MAANQYQPFITWSAQQFGVNPELLSGIAKYESGFRPGAVNDWDSNAAKGTPSAGMFQFIQPTFDSFYASASKARPKLFARLGPKDWRDWRQQSLVASYALKSGAGSHWATYDRALRDAGGNPFSKAVHGPFPGLGGGGAGGTAGWGGKATIGAPMVWKPGKPLDTGRINYLNRVLANKPWLIDDKTAPLYAAAQGKWVPGKGASLRYSVAGQPGAGGGFGGGSVGVLPRQNGEPAWKYLQRLGSSLFGLKNDPGNSQTFGGHHTAGSYHYKGQAIDFGDARNDWSQLNAFFNWVDQRRKQLGVAELLNEGDHVHVALNRGGRR